MIHNRDMLSDLKERKALNRERREPLFKITRLMNQFHALERVDYLEEDDKKQLRSKLKGQIYYEAKKSLSSSFVNKIDLYLKDWGLYEDEVLSLL